MNSQDLSQQELARIGFLSRRSHGNFIDGEFREAHSSARIHVVDPASEMVVADTPDSDAQDVNAAVAAARRALEDSAWSRMRPADRERILFRLSQLIEEHGDELSAMETLQSGKLQGVARMIDVGFSAEFVRYMAGWATKLEGSTLQNSIPFPPGARSAMGRRDGPPRKYSAWFMNCGSGRNPGGGHFAKDRCHGGDGV
jgi:phenylacetaldehyde dehydrogenase